MCVNFTFLTIINLSLVIFVDASQAYFTVKQLVLTKCEILKDTTFQLNATLVFGQVGALAAKGRPNERGLPSLKMSARTSLKAIAAQRMSAQVSYRQNTFLVSYSFPQLTVYLAIGAPGANVN